MKKQFWLFCIILFLSFSTVLGASLQLDKNVGKVLLGNHLEILEDKKNWWDIHSASSVELSSAFRKNQTEIPHFSASSSSYWIRFEVENPSASFELRNLEIGYHSIEQVELFFQNSEGKWASKVAGRNHAFSSREVSHRNYVFQVEFAPESRQYYYLHVQSLNPIALELTLWKTSLFAEASAHEYGMWGIYFGLMLIMAFHNLFIFVSIKDKNYLYYFSYVAGVFFISMCLLGFTPQFLWPNSSSVVKTGFYFFWLSWSIFWIFQFCQTFLNTKENTPWLHRVLTWAKNTLPGVVALFSFIVYLNPSATRELTILLTLMVLWGTGSMLASGIQCWRKGYKPARLFMVAWSFPMTGIFLTFLKDLGWIPVNSTTQYGLYLGIGANLILLSLALSERIRSIKETEFSIQKNILETQHLVTNIPGMIYKFTNLPNGKMKMLYASAACQDIFGISPAVVMGDASLLFKKTHPEDFRSLMQSFRDSRSSVTPWRWAGRMLVDGKVKWVHGHSKPERQVDGSIIWDGLLVDITERKDVEFKLEKAQKEAESASRAKSEFLANMSHEIRTPLNAIVGFCQILQSHKVNHAEPKEVQYLENINIAADNLSELINNILDLSKIESGKMDLSLEAINLRQLFQGIFHINEARALETHLNYSFRYDDGLPELIESDRTKLNQILTNLTSNAIKFTPMHKKVVLSARRENESIIFSVADEGIGIPHDRQEMVFGAFEQVESTKDRQFEGTGLGLAITKQLVELFDGKIWLESEVGVGTTFFVELPLKAVVSKEKEKMPVLAQDFHFSSDNLILVCEDNLMNQEMIKAMMEQLKVPVMFANNGRQGLEMLNHLAEENKKPNLVLMDMHMPEMDGISTIQAIRQIPHLLELPILMLTADVFSEQENQLEDLGVQAFLTKPMNLEKVLPLLAQFLKMEESEPERVQQHKQESEENEEKSYNSLQLVG